MAYEAQIAGAGQAARPARLRTFIRQSSAGPRPNWPGGARPSARPGGTPLRRERGRTGSIGGPQRYAVTGSRFRVCTSPPVRQLPRSAASGLFALSVVAARPG
jgi:hypothetical protein